MAEWRFLTEFWVPVDILPRSWEFFAFVDLQLSSKVFANWEKFKMSRTNQPVSQNAQKFKLVLWHCLFRQLLLHLLDYIYETREIFVHPKTEFFQIWLILIMYLISIFRFFGKETGDWCKSRLRWPIIPKLPSAQRQLLITKLFILKVTHYLT